MYRKHSSLKSSTYNLEESHANFKLEVNKECSIFNFFDNVYDEKKQKNK